MTEPPDRAFRAHLEAGRFMLQRSRATGAFIFYPRIAEPRTGCTDLDWVEVSGDGVVHATTVVRRRPPEADGNVALIDLAEGPRMMSRVEGLPPEAVTIGLKVRARITRDDDGPFIVFDPVP